MSLPGTPFNPPDHPRWSTSPRPQRFRAMVLACVLAAVTVSGRAADGASPHATSHFLRLAFSSRVVGEFNQNDAKASMIAWGKAILAQRIHTVEGIEPHILERAETVFDLMERKRIDGAVVLTQEFATRPASIDMPYVYLGMNGGKATSQFVLLVHRASGIADRAGLKGRSLELHTSARTAVALPWLDLTLAEANLGLAESVFKKIERPDKASRAVMRVFFRQADAVIVTREAFETMGELNPQLSKDLQVIATSPEIIPSAFFLRADLDPALKQEFESALLSVHETVPGRQAMTVFQTERLGRFPVSVLQVTLDLIANAARLRTAPPPSPARPSLAAGADRSAPREATSR